MSIQSILPRAALLVIAAAITACSGSDEPANPAATVAGPAAPAVATPPPPELKARSFVVIDHDSGRVLAALDPDSRQEPASLTKLMTAYVVFHALKEGRIKLDDMVTISENAWRQASPKLGGSAMFIEVGKQVSVEDLLQGMIVQSGNDATLALAEHVAGTEPTFVQMMNAFAKQLGLTGTHFEDSAGMPSPNQYITARDAALLASALVRDFPEYYKWYSQKEFTWNGITQQNRNGLLWRDPSVDGVKTGHTKTAGYCLVVSAKRGDMRLVSAVMGTDSMRAREDANAALLNYGFNFFETRRIFAAGPAVDLGACVEGQGARGRTHARSRPLRDRTAWPDGERQGRVRAARAPRRAALGADGARQDAHRRRRLDHRRARSLRRAGRGARRDLPSRDRHGEALVPLRWPSRFRPAT